MQPKLLAAAAAALTVYVAVPCKVAVSKDVHVGLNLLQTGPKVLRTNCLCLQGPNITV